MSLTDEIIKGVNKKFHSLKKIVSCTACTERLHRRSRSTSEELQESLNILREINKRLQRQILEKEDEIEKFKQENVTLKEKLQAKEGLFEQDRRILSEQIKSLENELNEKEVKIEKIEEQHAEYEMKIYDFKRELENNEALLKKNKNELKEIKLNVREALHSSYKKLTKKMKDDEITNLKKENHKLTQEVQSLKSTLELKEREIKYLRLIAAEAKQREEVLNIAMERIKLIQTRCKTVQEHVGKTSELKEDLARRISIMERMEKENEGLKSSCQKN